ncbi:hypothetical protein ABB29_11940 [Pseudoxanthomonas dokdonensis]|uniref:Uncharacterized protein n=1 Tax=Pseudoxanthomonas dokdonensis TaxID=344882 RepID=A0A0R0CI15_9GAMM|nr:hypothetical protein ABB29_11940 [Pseudoxanthomonas dokdonensis]
MPLPAPCQWIDSDEGHSYLRWHYGTVGVAYADGRHWVQGWGVRHEGRAASHAQGKRFVERWIAARGGLPGFGRRNAPTR